jgi:hypothetical protein
MRKGLVVTMFFLFVSPCFFSIITYCGEREEDILQELKNTPARWFWCNVVLPIEYAARKQSRPVQMGVSLLEHGLALALLPTLIVCRCAGNHGDLNAGQPSIEKIAQIIAEVGITGLYWFLLYKLGDCVF